MKAAWLTDESIELCSVQTLMQQRSLGFDPLDEGFDTLFAVYNSGRVFVYRNECPHQPSVLEFKKNKFLSKNQQEIICHAHGARFDIATGLCTHGPCLGKQLKPVAFQIIAEKIVIGRDG